MRITNIQKKELADKLLEAGLSTKDFETSVSDTEFKVKYKYEFFSFSINKIEDDLYEIQYCPINNRKGYSFRSKWVDFQTHYKKWALDIALDLKTATGWDAIDSQNYFNVNSKDFASRFTFEEKREILEGMNLLKVHVISLNVPIETLQAIEYKLEELIESVDDFSKFDWTALFIGTIANLIMVFAIPPEASGMLWHYIMSSFKSMTIEP